MFATADGSHFRAHFIGVDIPTRLAMMLVAAAKSAQRTERDNRTEAQPTPCRVFSHRRQGIPSLHTTNYQSQRDGRGMNRSIPATPLPPGLKVIWWTEQELCIPVGWYLRRIPVCGAAQIKIWSVNQIQGLYTRFKKTLGSEATTFWRFLFDKSLVRYPGKGLK